MTIFSNLDDYIPDPHTISGSWAIVGLIILLVIVAALALRVFAPIKATTHPSSAELAGTELVVATTGEA